MRSPAGSCRIAGRCTRPRAVVGKYPAGVEVQHLVPSHDMTVLYATDDLGNTLTPFNPQTGKPGARIPVIDPYNMYFTPDGRAIRSGFASRGR